MLPLNGWALVMGLVTVFVGFTDAKADDGAKLYDEYCMSCHQPDGYGVPFQQPALADSPMVNGPAAPLITFVLEGSQGQKNRVSEWENLMPGFSALEDDELAAIMTHIRSSFGNHASSITKNMVHSQRTPHSP